MYKLTILSVPSVCFMYVHTCENGTLYIFPSTTPRYDCFEKDRVELNKGGKWQDRKP